MGQKGRKITEFRYITQEQLNNDSLRWVVGDDVGVLYQPTIGQLKSLITVASWNLAGNSGSDPNTHFIGTTDNKDLVFKANNIQVLRFVNASNMFKVQGRNFGGGLVANNTFFGLNSGAAITTGTKNVFMGDDAGKSFTSGQQNVAIGYTSQQLNAAGTYNVSIGSGSLYSQTGGSYNVAIGAFALYYMTANTNNVAVGYYAGLNNQGADNTIVGGSAGRWLTAGNSNVYVGRQAGFNNNVGNANVYIGLNAANSAKGSNNTVIGASSGSNLVTGDNNLVLHAGTLPLADGSNQMNIGNRFYDTGNGNIGVLTDAPTNKFDINGDLRVRSIAAGTGGTDSVLVVDTNGVLRKIPASYYSVGAAPSWELTGNANINPSTQFIGTIDVQDVVFKRNNQEIFRLTRPGGEGTGNNSIFMGDYDANNFMRLNQSTLTISEPVGGSYRSAQVNGNGFGVTDYLAGLYATVATNVIRITRNSDNKGIYAYWNGFAAPQFTDAEEATLPIAQNGILYYNTTGNKFKYYDGTIWREIGGSGGTSINEVFIPVADAATMTIDYALGINFFLDGVTGTRNIAFSNTIQGRVLNLRVKSSPTGGSKLQFPAGFTKIPLGQGAGGLLTLTSAGNSVDIVNVLLADDGFYYVSLAPDYR